jgi:nickel-dependent lactate racemase
LTLSFPDKWSVKRCKMEAEDQPAMKHDEIKNSISNPIGTRSLTKLAENSEEVVIIFDDMTRPTKTYQYIPTILDILNKAEIPKDNIRFIIAPGTHGTFGRNDFVKKLGEEVVSEYQVYNHNPYEMLDYLGDTSYGCPVWVNSEVMACDLKIGVGTVLFHRLTGFSGGGKLISPGVAGIETIRYNHGVIGGFGPDLTPNPTTGFLQNELNEMRLDAEEAAKMAKLDFKIDSVLNLNRNPIEIFAGDFVKTQRVAGQRVKKWHATDSPEADIVVVGSYMRENEPFLGLWPGLTSVREGGTLVLLYSDPNGDINHWLFNRHGKYTGASLWNPEVRKLPKIKKFIVFGKAKLKSFELRYDKQQIIWIKEWEEVIEELKKDYGSGSKVAVIPDGTSCIPKSFLGE